LNSYSECLDQIVAEIRERLSLSEMFKQYEAMHYLNRWPFF